ncbi:MAG: hypothetical protein GF411_12740 [Candidatus Lokiarchaeota archaeon]|nr:hypothetical protein [Candidatus Lokiarchaeota archaeon]
MKEYLLYTGCTTPVRLPNYEASVKATLEKLGIKICDFKDVTCCGAQFVESLNKRAFAAMSGRILALAEKQGKDILAICGACNGSLKHIKHELDHDKELRDEINELLKDEGLEYTGNVQVRHLLQVLRDDIGYEKIKEATVKPLSGVRLSAHYGCHVTRPHEIMQVDDPENPRSIDDIIEAIGGIAVDYAGKTRCCGGPMLAMDEELAGKIGMEKILNVKAASSEGIVTACVFCDIQLTQVQFGGNMSSEDRLPIITVPQLLGYVLGIEEELLGFDLNKISPSQILEKAQEVK